MRNVLVPALRKGGAHSSEALVSVKEASRRQKLVSANFYSLAVRRPVTVHLLLGSYEDGSPLFFFAAPVSCFKTGNFKNNFKTGNVVKYRCST